MTQKEFQKSNLALELNAGKKRLENALHGLSEEQCEAAGATRSGSIVDLLSEIVTKEFVALMEVSDRLPNLPMNLFSNANGRTPTASGMEKPAASTSVDNLLAEFGFLRSAIDRRAEAREAELNQAIVDLSREDFLTGMFDLKALFSALFDRFYSEDIVQWLGAVESNGRAAVFQRMAAALEPLHTLLEIGLASIASFRATASAQDAEGNFTTDWEAVFGGAYSTGVAVCWRTVRAWKSRMVIAERIEDLPSSMR